MNQMMLYSKIVTIRDAQIQEKSLGLAIWVALWSSIASKWLPKTDQPGLASPIRHVFDSFWHVWLVQDMCTLPSDDIGKVFNNQHFIIWVCLKIVYPYTQWLMIITSTKWLFFGGYTPFFRHTHLFDSNYCVSCAPISDAHQTQQRSATGRRMVQGEREEEDLTAVFFVWKLGTDFKGSSFFPLKWIEKWHVLWVNHGFFRFTKATGGWGKAISP